MSVDLHVQALSGRRRLGPLALSVCVLIACGSDAAEVPEPIGDPAPVAAPFGDPLPDLTAAEAARFAAGHALFVRPFTVGEGVGPRFNENACNACHTDPVDGGTGETSVTKATRLADDGRCDLLSAAGGENLRIRSTLAVRGESTRVPVPDAADHSARFAIPFVFGLGVVDAIPEATLVALEDPDDLDGDGISGRLGRDAAGRAARFGRKSDVATLEDFVDSAFRLEMGLTTPSFPDEAHAGALPPLAVAGGDPRSEPEVDQMTVDAVTDYLRMLAPPVRARVTDAADSAVVERGALLFRGLNCVGCHVPTLAAGPSPIAAIDGAVIGLYSDLLLHDMGPELEGTCSATAGVREYRTEPLMGLRARSLFMHDGRFRRVIDAILGHDGEARNARDAFAALDRVTQEIVIRFLDTL